MNTARLLGIAAVCVLAGTAAWGRDLKTVSGEVYKNITVTKQDATGLQISHDEGVVFLDFRNLGPAEQKEFGYDPAAYVAGWKQKAAGDKARRDQALAAQQAAAARARAQAATNTPAWGAVAAQPYAPANQTSIEFTVEAPGFRYGPWEYYGRGFSNVIPPSQGGTMIPYPYNPYSPFPYYYGSTWGPTIIRQR